MAQSFLMCFARRAIVQQLLHSKTDGSLMPLLCPGCLRYIIGMRHENGLLRDLSTYTNPARLLKAFKKKRKKDKLTNFAEIIRVASRRGNGVEEKKALVRKTSPQEILKRLGVKIKNSKNDSSSKQLPKEANHRNIPNESVSNLRGLQPLISSVAVEKADLRPLLKGIKSGTLNEEYSEFQPEDTFHSEVPDEVMRLESLFEETPHGLMPEHLHLHDITQDEVHLHSSLVSDEEATSGLTAHSKKSSKQPNEKSKKLGKLKSKEREELLKVNQCNMEKHAKDTSMKLSLRSYLDVCVNTNMVNRAMSTLLNYRNKGKFSQNAFKLTDVNLYNIVLDALASKGRLERMKALLAIMKTDGVKPDLQTFASLLSCLSHKGNPEPRVIQHILNDCKDQGFQVSQIFSHCSFVGDQRERIAEVIRIVMPSLQRFNANLRTDYNCSLVNCLNGECPDVRRYSPAGSSVDISALKASAQSQLKRELNFRVTVKSIEKKSSPDLKTLQMRKKLSEWEDKWRVILEESFNKNLKVLQKRVEGPKYHRIISLYPYLKSLEPKVFVDIMLQEICHLAEASETFSPPMSVLQLAMGSKVMNRYHVNVKVKHGVVQKISKLYDGYCDYFANPELTKKSTPRQYWQLLMANNPEGPSIDMDDKSWPYNVLVSIGKFLYDILLNDVKIDVILSKTSPDIKVIPAFYNIYRSSGLHLKEEIKPHPNLTKLYKLADRDDLNFESCVVPMLSPPLPWSSVQTGGLLISNVKIIRLPELAVQQKLKLEKTLPQQLFPIFDALNQLGECPWIINQPLLDLIIEVFNNNGDEKLDIPPPPSECSPLPKLSPEMSKLEKSIVIRDRALLKRRRAEMYSLWCDGLYKLSIANHFRDAVFWFPHNMDFRGRVYPCPPHFNHLGSDFTRSLLMFAKGEPLGCDGLDWLKIHLVNLTGLKKREPVHERLKFANEMIDEILDSADNPLKGRRWWTASDEPWQTLACCKEIANAIRLPDPSKYICHFPVHQDGSCNGLQHYAALGRDQHGAEQVNLHPSPVPQDVYSGVAALVEAERAKDAANGIKIAQILEGFIKRKVIKQTVMTTVYGVTRYGARLQIIKQLKDIPDFPQEHQWSASGYLVQKTFQSLHVMFTSAREIQDWFTECARLISQVCGQPVEWVTPLGLPVVQPYHRLSKSVINLLASKTHQKALQRIDIHERPNTMKQKNAFPPNFIHSLDSTHMMLTSLFCQRVGITFTSVHDCYWTHPNTVNIMNKVCREQFVAMHSESILENLSQFLVKKYSYNDRELHHDGSPVDQIKKKLNRVLSCVPEKGNFVLENVLKSTYFFS